MRIEARIRSGSGQVRFFADVIFEDHIEVRGCPVFGNKDGNFRVAMPTRPGKEEGHSFPVVKISPSVEHQVQEAVIEAIKRELLKESAQSSEPPAESGPAPEKHTPYPVEGPARDF